MALYNGNDSNNTITGSASADEIYGLGGGDTLNGLGGNDSLSGGYGNDTLNGGAGDDELHGGAGDDTYVFGVGAGNDTIYEWDDSGYGGSDQVLLAGLSKAAVTFQRTNASDLALTIKSTGETLLVQNAFSTSTSYNLEAYSFADGILTLAQVNTLLGTGGAGNDILYGWTGNDTLTGNAGNDILKRWGWRR
jgi:Ca2+-binding RTX toxin-like protein